MTKMKLFSIIVILFFQSSFLYSQEYNFKFSFGEFEDAESFYINPSGVIYITDSGSDEIYSYDTLGTFLKETGGYGWTENTFDDPVDISATSLNVYVCDKNNHRIQSFDKDLNYISQLTTRESENFAEQFGYPVSCTVSPQGDLYILDSENKRVLKFDMFGNFIQNFGGYDAGEYSLKDPIKLSVSPVGYIYVLDKSRLVVFDQYGNGILIQELNDKMISINIIFNQLSANSDENVYQLILNSSDKSFKKIMLTGFDETLSIQSTLFFKNKLFVLTQNEILVYEKASEK